MKLGTVWPLPEKLITKYINESQKVLLVEEMDPFVEQSVMELSANLPIDSPRNTFYGKRSGHIDAYGEQNPDTVIKAITDIMDLPYQPRNLTYGEKIEETSKKEIIGRSGVFALVVPIVPVIGQSKTPSSWTDVMVLLPPIMVAWAAA